ncbi:hypothetical protein OP10G_3633 [Fimbriimonas ginsengisoli Gsoil 348]|uniref:Uncharacterized protein n=1 Tax=Fimbriimonas ginsengisoli Gsoil 348 TaxID=661478 RepID=A0A068NU86_FIMGI|nr:hypothetical protein OP10G_3633 [Fimbriimonas ginsengisoli Gsoil 348]
MVCLDGAEYRAHFIHDRRNKDKAQIIGRPVPIDSGSCFC